MISGSASSGFGSSETNLHPLVIDRKGDGMPYYKPLKKLSSDDRKRTVAGIQRLRKQLEDTQFPGKKTTKSLIVGTWNIRNFDDDRFNFGPRTKEAMYYIAELVSRFDVLAVQEICEDLGPLNELMALLGREYDYIVTDVTHSGLGGNTERLGFIYDRNKVFFKGVAGEIVLPDTLLVGKKKQFARTPFGVDFQSGWFKFKFSTVHIYYGEGGVKSEAYARRVEEIKTVAKYLAKEASCSDVNHILVGDFNILKKGSACFNALVDNGFTAFCNDKGSTVCQTKFYDQISFLPREGEVEALQPERTDRVFQYFDSVFRADDFEVYKPIMLSMIASKLEMANMQLDSKNKSEQKAARTTIKTLTAARKTDKSLKAYYDKWRTFQMSDHLPLWVELNIDFSNKYLEYLSTYDPGKA